MPNVMGAPNMTKTTRSDSGCKRAPLCPRCKSVRVRVKRQPRLAPQQLWQCPKCGAEWTNPMLQLEIEEQEPPT